MNYDHTIHLNTETFETIFYGKKRFLIDQYNQTEVGHHILLEEAEGETLTGRWVHVHILYTQGHLGTICSFERVRHGES